MSGRMRCRAGLSIVFFLAISCSRKPEGERLAELPNSLGIGTIAVDETGIYLGLNSAGIMRLDLDGGSPLTLMPQHALGREWLYAPVLGRDAVYAAINSIGGGIIGVPKDGGDYRVIVAEATSCADAGAAYSLLADQSGLFWREVRCDLSSVSTVRTVPLDGGAPIDLGSAPYSGPPHENLGLAADSANLYWAETGSFVMMPKSGGPQTRFPVGVDVQSFPGVLEGRLYWSANQSIYQMPTAGGAALELARVVHQIFTPWGLGLRANTILARGVETVIDGDQEYNLYSLFEITRRDDGTASVRTITSDNRGLCCAALDGTYIYWVEYSGAQQTLFRTPRR